MKRNSSLKQEHLRPEKVTLQYSEINEISILKSHTSILPAQLKVFLFCLSVPQPISFVLVMMKAGSNCCKLTLKATEEDEEEFREVAASNISVEAAIASVLSKPDGTFTLKAEQR